MQDHLNELGIKKENEKYACRVCGRVSTLAQAEREEWHYRLTGETEEGGGGRAPEAEYLCPEHYRVLSKKEAGDYVPVGYPYHPSRDIDGKNLFTF